MCLVVMWIYCFNYVVSLSYGKLFGDILVISVGVEWLVCGIVS